jgi:hypothetical protein
MPNSGDVSPCSNCSIRRSTSGRMAVQTAILAKRLYANNFSVDRPVRGRPENRLGGRSFQKIKQPLLYPLPFAAKSPAFVRRTKIVDFIVRCTIYEQHYGAGISRPFTQQSGKDSIMIKVEDMQQYGKEQLETVVASATTVQHGLQAIASAYGDYTKKSFEDTKSFVEKLSGVKSIDKALEVQTEFAKSAYESFVAESQKIAALYTDLAKQTYKPFEGMVAKFTPAATV